MSIVSSSHTPQGRGEEKGANYKEPNPALPDFSSSGIGPPIHFGTSSPSAGSALSGDPPPLLGTPRVSRSARRGGEVPSSGGAPTAAPRSAAARRSPGAPRLSPAVPRGHPARASSLPATLANGRNVGGFSQARWGAVRCGPVGALPGPRGALPAPEQRPAAGREAGRSCSRPLKS